MYCNNEHPYLRPLKAKALQAAYEESFLMREELDVWIGQNATILPLKRVPGDDNLFGRGGVVDQEGNYIPLSGLEGSVCNPYPFSNSEYKDEKVVYCGYLVNHWGHFLVDAVSRLWYFLENDNTIDKYVFFLDENEEREIKGNYKEFFVLLKIWDKLELINKPTTYREVVLPEIAYRYRKFYSPKYLKIFDTISNNAPEKSEWENPTKIYFSRSQLSKASENEFGQEVFDEFFEKNGYTILYPEKVPLTRMVHYIRNAEVVASLSGSLPHNMSFGRNNQNLVIIERYVLNNDFQTNINRMKNLNVTYIDANIPIYTVNMAGPFIMGCTPYLDAFASDHDMQLPNKTFYSSKFRKACFKKYMHAYQDMYRYQWYMEDWYTSRADYLWEAYKDGYAIYADYLNGSKPFLLIHHFQFHYWKQFLKRILKKLKIL